MKMVNSEEIKSGNGREIDDVDYADQSHDGDCSDDSSSSSGSGNAYSSASGGSGLSERLNDILMEDGNGDLLLQQSDRENTVMQWLQALDMQVIGACRADERLKPLLKRNVSTGVAEDRLLFHLSQYFEPSEVGMLARCLCIPLVSVRVGKIKKQGTFLCPTSARGNLNLTLLPKSDLRISFVGDDGCMERLATLTAKPQSSAVEIEEISEDRSGRSFLLRSPDGGVFYFWCSEKSKLLGHELLRKMKDLLKKRPSLAELTGIGMSRLDSFATHLRAYLVGSVVTNGQSSSFLPSTSHHDASVNSSEHSLNAQTSRPLPSRSRHVGSQGAKTSPLHQSSLSPRLNSFKEPTPRNLSSLKNATREKLKLIEDGHLSGVDNSSIASSNSRYFGSICSGKESLAEGTETGLLSPSSLLESLTVDPPLLRTVTMGPPLGLSIYSPHYCWCPPAVSTLQFSVGDTQVPMSSAQSLPLPPLSSLLSTTRVSGVLGPKPPLNLADLPPMDFPPLLPEPLVRLPLSVSASQQIPTFTPLMCDPIVHVPVIDVCSSGQGYLVSAGPALSTTIPPLHPTLVNPLIPDGESLVEKGARETLRLLISGSDQLNPQLMDVFPSVLANGDDKQSIVAVGSRGLYSGTRDVDSMAKSIGTVGFVALSDRSEGDCTTMKRSISRDDLVSQMERAASSDGCSRDDGFPNIREQKD